MCKNRGRLKSESARADSLDAAAEHILVNRPPAGGEKPDTGLGLLPNQTPLHA